MLILLLFVFLSVPFLPAQACSQCRDNVAASAPQTQRGFRRGILVLGIAAAGVFLGMLQVARSHRDGGGRD